MGFFLHGHRRCAGKSFAGPDDDFEQDGIRPRVAGEHSHRRAVVADDLSDDVEGGFQCDWRHRAEAERLDGDAVHQLAGQAVQHGPAWLAVYWVAIPAAAAGRANRAEPQHGGSHREDTKVFRPRPNRVSDTCDPKHRYTSWI